MKKRIAVLLVGIIFILSGCKGQPIENDPTVLNSYPTDTAPSQVIKTNNYWVCLNSTYGSIDFTISISETYKNDNIIYSAKDIDIWYIEANDNAIVWCEKSSEYYTYKVYNIKTKQTETIFQAKNQQEYQAQNVGIFENCVYYSFIDYESNKVIIYAYNLDEKTIGIFYSADYNENLMPYSMVLENEYLMFVCSNHSKVLNVKNNQTIFDSPLPDNIKYVFSASYDSINDTCILYYTDGDTEDIGILDTDKNKVISVFTLSENHYAYLDKIRAYDGHIYWIVQANVSGNVSDHYTLINYNYLEHKPIETKRAFNFYLDVTDLYSLRYDRSGDYTAIELCKE